MAISVTYRARGVGISLTFAKLLAGLREHQAELGRMPEGDAFDDAAERETLLVEAILATPAERLADLLFKFELLHGELNDGTVSVPSQLVVAECRRFALEPEAASAAPLAYRGATTSELLELFRRWRAAVAHANALDPAEDNELLDAACAAEVKIFKRLMQTPARTPEGFNVKLHAVAKLKGWETRDPADESLGLDEQAIAAVMLDAERLFGRAPA